MKLQYAARPNPNEQPSHARWWGSGGAELFDELDPGCVTEGRGWVGPFEAEVMESWKARAREIPGWTDRDPPIQVAVA